MLRRASFALMLVLMAGSSALGQEWARKMFKETSHDFGSVAHGAKTEFRFELSNIYLEDVHIASVRSSCGCTSPSIEAPSLKTYEKGAIVAKYNSHLFYGHKGATITVTIDKPFYATVQLHVKGYIRSEVEFTPGSVQFGAIDRGQSAEKTVSVSRRGMSNWKILEVRSANPHIKVEAVPRATQYVGRVTYDLKVHLDENAPTGFLRDRLVLVTNDRSYPQVPVLVEGQITSSLAVSPATLFMGVVKPGEKVTKRLVIKGKRPFKIVSIDCEDDSFEFDTTASSSEAKMVHIVPVTYVAGEGSGKVVKTIRIQTDLDDFIPELSAYAVISAPQ